MPEDTGTAGPFYIVMNAGSGHNDSTIARETIAGVLSAAGREHQFLCPDEPSGLAEKAAEAVRLAQQHRGVVVAAGGDGTLSEVAQAAFGQGVSFGVLPQGTFNLFGRAYGISEDTEQQTRALLGSHVERVQVGLVNDRVFLVNASVGFYPQVLEDRETYKARFGRSRVVAILAGFVTLARYRRQLRLDVEEEGRSYSLKTPTLFVGNNRLQLERIGIETSHLDRDRLAGVVVRPIRTRHMLWLALRGALGKLGDAEHVQDFSLRKLTVQPHGKRRVKVATDGEVQWMQTPLTFRVAPHALPLLVPAAEDAAEVA